MTRKNKTSVIGNGSCRSAHATTIITQPTCFQDRLAQMKVTSPVKVDRAASPQRNHVTSARPLTPIFSRTTGRADLKPAVTVGDLSPQTRDADTRLGLRSHLSRADGAHLLTPDAAGRLDPLSVGGRRRLAAVAPPGDMFSARRTEANGDAGPATAAATAATAATALSRRVLAPLSPLQPLESGTTTLSVVTHICRFPPVFCTVTTFNCLRLL